MSKTPTRPAESDDRFTTLMHRFMSAVERLKLATEKLRNLEGVEEALPQEFIPAAFVVEEATQALEQIHEDLDDLGPPPGTPSARPEQGRPLLATLGGGRCTCPRCDGEGCDWCEPDESGQPKGYLRAA